MRLAAPNAGQRILVCLGSTRHKGDSVRDRVCRECDHRWRTLQPPEEVLDPSILVKFPRWKSPEGSRRQVTLEYVTKAR